MRPNWMIGILLAAAAFLSAGASPEGVQEARRWQLAGDVARAHEQWDVAYTYYTRIAETFPGTPHGRLAANRVVEARFHMLWPRRSPAEDSPASWLGEMIDFLTWP